MIRVAIVQDNDAHWFVIPAKDKEKFFVMLEEADIMDNYLDFIKTFGKHLTGGDINNVKLYAEK
jgi:hypothetical protein